MMINIWGLYTYFNISDMMYSHPHWTFSVSKMIKYLRDKKNMTYKRHGHNMIIFTEFC